MDQHSIEGYIRCCECGRHTPWGFAKQTGRRCSTCWTGGSPLLALEVMHRTSRGTMRIVDNKDQARWPKRVNRKPNRRLDSQAWHTAVGRLRQLFPDIFAVLLDEERVKRGLHPLARYNPVEYEDAVSKTLDFNDVYDALRSSGVEDGT